VIDTKDTTLRENCLEGLDRLFHRLLKAKESDNWDLADFCLAQCGDSISAVLSTRKNTVPGNGTSSPQQQSENGFRASLPEVPRLEDLELPLFQGSFGAVEGMQYPWSDLWDMFYEPQSNTVYNPLQSGMD
jgi:hypothetical protein